MATQGQVNVQVDGARVSVEGRIYEGSHIILLGASKMTLSAGFAPPRQEGEWDEGLASIKVSATFDGYPSVETEEDVVKISMGSTQLPEMGSESIKVAEVEDGYIVEGQRLIVKFEVDEVSRKVIVRMPGIGSFKVSSLSASIEGYGYLNLIVRPFIMGLAIVEGTTRSKVLVSGSSINVVVGSHVEVKAQAADKAPLQKATEGA